MYKNEEPPIYSFAALVEKNNRLSKNKPPSTTAR